MAVNQGPQISRTGLVSYYDISNEKSFRGLTATNLMYGIIAAYSPANDNTYFKTSYGSESVFIPYFNQLINVRFVDIYNDYNGGSNNCCPSPFSFHSTPITITGNTTYMFQLIFKTDTGYYSTNYMYRYEHGASGYIKEGGLVSQDGGTPAANARIESLGDGWYHAWGSFTSAAAATTLYTYLFHYEYATWNRIRVAGVSLTQGSVVHRPEHILNLNYRESRGTTVATGGGLKDLVSTNDGELLNGVSFASGNGGSLVFDGTNDYVQTPTSSSLNFGTGNFSIFCWMKSSYFADYQTLVALDNSSTGNGILLFTNPTDGVFRTWVAGQVLNGSINICNGSWNFVGITRNSGVVTQWINGVSYGTFSAAGSVLSSQNLRLGSYGSGYYLNGNIAQVSIYNSSLTAKDVLGLYNSSRSKINSSTNRNTILTRQIVNPKSNTSLLASTVLYIDPANKQSYTPGSQFMYDLSPNRRTLTMYTNGGTTHYLTPYASIPLSTDGKGSLSFDGTNDWIRMSSNMTIATTVTVSVWVKTTASGDRGIFSHCSGGPVVLGYSVETYMKYWYYFGQWYTLTGYVAINDGIWKNIVWTKNGTNFKMYVNGILDREVTLNGDVSGLMRTIGTLWGPCNSNNGDPGTVAYGPGTDSYGSVFSGLMGPLIVYSRTLAAAEVTSLYNNFRTRFSHVPIVTTSLILHLNASNRASYSGTGTVWSDLSGNGNHFTLYNGASFNSDRGGYITFDGVNDYAASTNNLNLTSYDYIAVEIYYKSNTTNTISMLFEHTSSWNSNAGGLGLAINTNGNSNVANMNHTNHNTEVARNYEVTNNLSWNNNLNLFSRISDSTGRLAYSNSNLVSFTSAGGYGTTTTTTANGSFANAIFYIGSRGGVSEFFNGSVASVKIYGYKISQNEVVQNFNSERWRFGI